MLVSGDFIRAQKKYGQPFEFSNYAKLIFSANEIPQSEDIRGQNLTHFVRESPSSLTVVHGVRYRMLVLEKAIASSP